VCRTPGPFRNSLSNYLELNISGSLTAEPWPGAFSFITKLLSNLRLLGPDSEARWKPAGSPQNKTCFIDTAEYLILRCDVGRLPQGHVQLEHEINTGQ
jgi:hypothetical protein